MVAEHKKVLISVPSALLKQLDDIAKKDGSSRNETVRNAIKDYVAAGRKKEIAKRLTDGYQNMAEINSEMAEFCLEADNECVVSYEAKLAQN